MSEHSESPFVFVGEVMALDLVNTEVAVRGKPADLLQTPDELMQWWALCRQNYPDMEAVSGPPPIYDEALLDVIKVWRGSLRRLFSDIAEGTSAAEDDINALNSILRRASPMLIWRGDHVPQWGYSYDNDPQVGVLLPIALSALRLLTSMDLGRLRKCHNHRCVLLFYDTTKSATRHWCSPACLDRERSARRYEEKKRSLEN